MGVILRQGIWSSVISYVGVGLGYIATLIVFPKFLEVDQIGLIRLIQSNGLMLIPLVTIGLPSYWILQFPEIKERDKSQSEIFSLVVLLVILANILIILCYKIFQDYVDSFFIVRSQEYLKYVFISMVILSSQSLYDTFSAFFRTQYNISIPGYFKEIHLRLVNLIIVSAFGLGVLQFNTVIYLMGINYISTTVILFFILSIKYRFRFTLKIFNIDRTTLKKLVRYGGYFAIISIGTSVMNNIGFLLTSTLLGLEENGIYTTCLYIGVIIEMPRRAASQILTPLIADSYAKNDQQAMKDVFYRSSINLSIISMLLFIGIMTNLNDLFILIPKGDVFKQGVIVVLLVALSKVVGMAFGATGEFLTYSPYKRYNLYGMLASSIIMIGCSALLIPIFGIGGAAWGILISMVFQQLFSFGILYHKQNLFPFRLSHLKLIVLSICLFMVAWLVPINFSPLINIVIRSIITGSIFMVMVYYLKLSQEINQLIHRLIKLDI